MRRIPLKQVNSNTHRTSSSAVSTKSVRKSLKIDQVANQLKAIESLEYARQYEEDGNLEEALRYYEIAQDHLPTPSADLRVKIMNLKSSSDMKFKKSRKKEATINVSHDRQVQEILNKNNKPIPEIMYPSVDFTDELENQEPENSTVSFETEEVVQDEGGNVQPMRAPSLNSSSKQVIEEKEEAEDYWPETSIAADVDDDEDSHQFHESNDPVLEEKRLSSVSCVSSAPPPREEVLSILQERTLQALEYQLFDRLNNGDFHELTQLKMIGPKRAHYILELRQEYLEKMESLSERHQSIDGKKDGYFQSIEQLQDIGMKLKDCHTFLKKNVTLLAGLEQK